ncbi:hypothetical protein N9Z88_01325 [Akkermansiaceae bacterium]|nr:hypothetical protein [Akkermansiaceae bacterium]MDB4545653.1 hypothetical protein [Akkermansiaceae bacterium]
MSDLSEISRPLAVLRRRIRRVQLTRGLLRLATVLLGGILLIAALDFIFAPLSSGIRLALFVVWIGALAWTAFEKLLQPLRKKITDIQLARWLERRHPEVQERISTSLELAGDPEGISPQLLEELSVEAASDLSLLDPKEEVSNKRVRRSLWPLASLAGVIVLLLAIFPQQMSRLLARAIVPFSDMGNAEGFRFSFDPGDVEAIEGDEVVLKFSYEGTLSEPLALYTKTESGELLSETLQPVTSDGDDHEFEYRLHGASRSFDYFARAGKGESDHFSVRVYPQPSLENATVRYRYPDYTGWTDRVADFKNGLNALSGTEVVIKSRFQTGIESARVTIDDSSVGDPSVIPSATGADFEFTFKIGEPGEHEGVISLDHRIRENIEASRFRIVSTPDEAPVVKLIEPTQRELKLQPDDQIILTYGVIEQIGLSSAEIELEVSGKNQQPLKEALPERAQSDTPNLWNGEAMVYLGSLLDAHPKARKFRLRLKLSDNCPTDLSGPGVGYSDWIEVTLDNNAPSLARQELRAQQSDIRETIDKAMNEIRQAQQRMHHVKNHLEKEEIPEHAQKQLEEAKAKLAETESELAKLAERMGQGVQAHRADEVMAAAEKVAEAKQNLEFAPLQDTPESRRSEVEEALRNSEDAIKKLREQRNEMERDRARIEDLARLQELAQKQDALAREASAEAEPDKEWQQKQEKVKNELREIVKQSPQAKAAALEAQAKRAKDLAEEADALAESQDQLKELAQEKPSAEQIADAFKREQAALAEEAKDLADSAKGEASEAQATADSAKEKATEAQAAAESAKEAVSEAQAATESEKEAASKAQAEAESAKEAASEAQAAAEAAQPKAEALAEQSAKSEKAAQQAEAARDASSPEDAAKKANEAAEALAEASADESLQEKQETVAEGLEALAEGDQDKALAALEKLQSQKIEEALKQEQAAIAEDAKSELAEARSENAERANTLPEAVAQAEAARDAAEPAQSAEAAKSAAEALAEGEGESISQAELQDRQEQVAEAFAALDEGNPAEALATLEKLQAERAADLAEELREFPQASDYNQALNEAQNKGQDAANRADQAMKEQANGQAEQAAQLHEQSSDQFEKASEALAKAAEQFQQQAEQAAAQEPNQNKAPAPGQPLAEAFEQSAQAAQAAKAEQGQEAAESAQAAAESLKSAAQQAKSAMAQNQQPGQGNQMAQGEPSKGAPPPDQEGNQPGDKPGDDPQEGDPQAQADPGVPPELARLGVSASDWEKIKATLKSDIGGARGAVVPEDYRGLVKQYFEQVTKER